jgi:hypothetical protein
MATFSGLASRVLTSLLSGTGTASFGQTGGIRVTQFDAMYMDAVREGRKFYCGVSAAITGIAPAQLLVTTAPQWSIWNASTTKTMYFTSIGLEQTAVAAQGTTGVSVRYCVYTTPASSGMYSGMAVQNSSPTSTNTSAVIVKTAVTITLPAAPVWCSIAQSYHVAAAAHANLYVGARDVFGGIALPPLSGLGLCAYASVATGLMAPACEWIEVEATQY